MSAGTILITLFFLLAPAGVLRLCRQFPTLGKIGPVLILYLIGILVGNLFHPAGMARIQQALSSAMVPLAIPLMLFSCTFRRSGTRSQLLALLSGMLAVTAAVIAGYLLLQVLLARLLKIDADTMTISSVAYICSPPFVPMMAAAMNNRRVLAGGLAVGVIGYAAGNYLGFLISRLLTLL